MGLVSSPSALNFLFSHTLHTHLTGNTMAGPKLRFCPESNDLLYPKEDRERKRLIYVCRNCGYKEDAAPSDWCVYRNEVHHTSREKSIVLQVGKNRS